MPFPSDGDFKKFFSDLKFFFRVGFILLVLGAMIAALTSCKSLHVDEKAAKWLQECAPVPGVAGAEFCAYETGKNPTRTIFKFHGLADAVQTVHESLFKHSRMQQVTHSLSGARIVTLSWGHSWLIGGKNSPTVDEFLKAVAAVGEKYSMPKPWIGMGHSMGGHNLLTLASAKPDLFQKIVLTNPMIVSLESFDRRTKISAGNYVEGKFDRAAWFNANPFALISRTEKLPAIYIQACTKDRFKLEPDTTALVELMKSRGFAITYERFEDDCSHEDVRPQGVVNFIATPLPISRKSRL